MIARSLALGALTLGANVGSSQGPVSRIDRYVTHQVRRPSFVASPTVRRSARVLDFLGGTGVLVAGGGLYVAGRAADRPRLADLGLYSTEAVIAGSLVTGALKTIFGRARPYVSADSNPGDFGFWRGWSNDAYRSLPSGHATAAFSFAAAVAAELSRTRPRTADIAAPTLYTGATLVGLARVYGDKHWATDVLLGAAIGVLAGRQVVRLNR